MSATEVTAYGLRHKPEHDRMSTILGRPCRIMQPLGTPKAREDCEPFSFTFHDPSGVSHRRIKGKNKRFGPQENVAAQLAFTKKLATLTKQQAKRAA